MPAWTPGDKQDEKTKWQALSSLSSNAFNFWRSFLILKMGPNNDQDLSQVAISQYMLIIRCVSWVESNHGTGTGSSLKDPMQCGNPKDLWWKELIAGQNHAQERDRFISGPGGANYWAEELTAAAEARGSFPSNAKVDLLDDIAQGHKNGAFAKEHSFFWGVPYLIHRINNFADDATFKCGDYSKDRMLGGAKLYNGGGVSDYRERIEKTWTLITT